MNKKWDKRLTSILGSFWDKLFKDHHIISWVKKAIVACSERWVTRSDSIMSYLSVQGARHSIPEYVNVRIPVSECIINIKDISDYKLSGLVGKSSDIRSLAIPSKYLDNAVLVVDSIGCESTVWVDNINMTTSSDYVVLYAASSYEFPREVEYINNELVPVYTIYKVVSSSLLSYNDSFGIICGDDMDSLDDAARVSAWKSYIQGPTEYDVRILAASGCYNAICKYDSIVADVWAEGRYNHIMTEDGNAYSGIGLPKVVPGDSVFTGDILFSGMYTWNKESLPSPDMIPYLSVPSGCGDLVAINRNLPVISSGSGYIPDMGNSAWAKAMINDGKFMILSNEDVNPAHYVLNAIYPSNSSLYSIDTTHIQNYNAITTACKYITDTINTSPVSSITCYVQSETGSVSIYTSLSEVCVNVSSIDLTMSYDYTSAKARFI